MLRSTAIALMKQILGFRRDADTSYVTSLVAAQEQLEINPVKPWFLLTENATTFMTIGEQRVPLPSDFLEEHEDDALFYMPSDTSKEEVPLIKRDLDYLKGLYTRTATGEPETYALVNDYFRVFPTPDDTYELKMIYYARDESLADTDLENKFLKWVPYLLIGQAGLLMATGLRDKSAREMFAKMASDGLLLMNSQNEARAQANREMQIGGAH